MAKEDLEVLRALIAEAKEKPVVVDGRLQITRCGEGLYQTIDGKWYLSKRGTMWVGQLAHPESGTQFSGIKPQKTLPLLRDLIASFYKTASA